MRARAERNEARGQAVAAKVQARVDALAAREAERVDTRTAELQAPEVAGADHEPGPEPVAVVAMDSGSTDTQTIERAGGDADQAQSARLSREQAREAARAARAEAKEQVRRERQAAAEATDDASDKEPSQAAKDAARAARAEAKERARLERQDAKRAAREAKAQARATVADDHIVEPPPELKLSRTEKRRQRKAEQALVQTPSESSGSSGGRRVGLMLAAVAAGIGLVGSVVLAIGAFLVALGTDMAEGISHTLATVCDFLVGPLGNAFSFSGANADMKEALVAWGAGSMIYLVVFWIAQSYLGSRTKQ